MLSDKLEELLDVLGASLVESRIVDVDDDLLEVVILFLPLKQVLGSFISAEVLKEDQHGQMLEVALLKVGVEE